MSLLPKETSNALGEAANPQNRNALVLQKGPKEEFDNWDRPSKSLKKSGSLSDVASIEKARLCPASLEHDSKLVGTAKAITTANNAFADPVNYDPYLLFEDSSESEEETITPSM